MQRIDKSNKRLKGTNPLLTNRRHSFERARTYWSVKTGTWLAIDIESWERDHTVLTEFGWSRIQWSDGGVIRDEGHLVCKKYENYRNGTWVPDNRQVRKLSSSTYPCRDLDLQGAEPFHFPHSTTATAKVKRFRYEILSSASAT